MQLYGGLDVVSFIRINRLRWIGNVNRMDNERMVCQVFDNEPQGSRPRGRPKCRWWDCVYGEIRKCKIRNWEQRSKIEKTGRGPLRKRKPTKGCTAN
jgi:hypothetical protein